MCTYYLGNAWKIALGCSICRKHSIVKSNLIIKCIKKLARFTYFVIKLAKKGDLRDCNNYQGIMLLSVPGKVFNRVLLERMKEAVDPKLQDQQAGFRRNRSCADQIASLHIWLSKEIRTRTKLCIFNSQCEVSLALQMQNLEDDKDNATENPDILQHLSAAHLQHPMARVDPKWRAVGASGTGTSNKTNPEEEVGLDWTYPQEASIHHHIPSSDLEPAVKEEERREAGLATAGGEALSLMSPICMYTYMYIYIYIYIYMHIGSI